MRAHDATQSAHTDSSVRVWCAVITRPKRQKWWGRAERKRAFFKYTASLGAGLASFCRQLTLWRWNIHTNIIKKKNQSLKCIDNNDTKSDGEWALMVKMSWRKVQHRQEDTNIWSKCAGDWSHLKNLMPAIKHCVTNQLSLKKKKSFLVLMFHKNVVCTISGFKINRQDWERTACTLARVK